MKNYSNILILSIAIIISTFLLADAYKNRGKNHRQGNIQVTGLGKKDFNADLIVWSASFSKKSNDIKSGYKMLKEDKEIIEKWLLAKGLQKKDFVFSSVDISKDYKYEYDKNGHSKNVFNGYNLSQGLSIESGKVDEIEQLSREITELIDEGIELYSGAPQYFYTRLAELKVEMIASATKDARTRAEKIAFNSGAKIGELKDAQMGVFQIVAQNSDESYSWGGTYNTSSRKKTASITMKLEFGVENK